MKNQYQEFLFNKHILVSKGGNDMGTCFYVLFTLANKLGIEITKGQELADIKLIRFASQRLGTSIPEPFYRGFPNTVRALSRNEIAFDQIYNYFNTYDMNNFDEARHSVMEESFTKLAFKEKGVKKSFEIVDEETAKAKLFDAVMELLKSSRPLNEYQYTIVKEVLAEFDNDIPKIASINTAVKLYYDTRDERILKLLKLSDVIKLADHINFTEYGKKTLKKLNFKNKDRRVITEAIRKIFQLGKCNIRACYEKRADWCGLLHHIHYKPATKEEELFLMEMRSNSKNKSVYSQFEALMEAGDIKGAVECLRKGKGAGAIIRSLDYIASRCQTSEELDLLLQNVDSKSIIFYIQLLQHYYFYTQRKRTFKFARHNLMTKHDESKKEMARRKSYLEKEKRDAISAAINHRLREICKGRLGKVYIDKPMKNIALPLQESASSSGFGVLPRGSRIPVDMSRVIRAFTYWSGVNDVDLSCHALTADGGRREFSWRNMRDLKFKFITFSGDQTSGYNGGSEYFDIDVTAFKRAFPLYNQLLFCNNVYSAVDFSSFTCQAGYMVRDKISSGEVFEPKTVSTSFNITCRSTTAYMFAIDLLTDEIVWLNIGEDSKGIVAGDMNLNWVFPYLFSTKIINVYSFFEMLADEIVSTTEEAEIIVSDKDIALSEGQEQIHSYDIERILGLMNE